MAAETLLIIDDEEAITWSLKRAFERAGFGVFVAPTAEKGLALAAKSVPQVILLDIRLPGMDGLTALERFQKLVPTASIVIMTAHGNLSTAVRAVEGGAFEYLTKPFDLAQMQEVVSRAFRSQKPHEERVTTETEPQEIIGRSPAMQNVFRRIALVAPHDSCVMITGESGTGKELAARAIHRYSPRRNKPYLPVHVASLNPGLVESELFGHTRGAFTGAVQPKIGLLVLANGGTVFLDELGDIPLSVQAKLLRVLEYQEVLPVGGSEPTRIDIRILSATHRNLRQQMETGEFRHDLYYRLNGFEIVMPPLRDRLDDIPLLADHLLRKYPTTHLPESTLRWMGKRPWPGNVRELKNALEHAAILARNGPILPEHFPALLRPPETESSREEIQRWIRDWVNQQVSETATSEPRDLYERLQALVDKALLDEVLKHVKGNRLAATRWLGIARATLRKMMLSTGLTEETGEEGSSVEGE